MGENGMYRILVCDDERDIVSALRIYLTAEGYEVLEAYNGSEMLRACRHAGGASHPARRDDAGHGRLTAMAEAAQDLECAGHPADGQVGGHG